MHQYSGASNRFLPVTREAVEWAYRFILGRVPESEAAIDGHMDLGTVAELRFRFQNAPEVTGGVARNIASVPAHIIDHFQPWTGQAEPDSFRDFLGTRTRLSYMPEPYAQLAGTTEGVPGTERAAFHDIAEWTGLLSAALEARDRFVGVELGAGWGPWVVSGAAAARHLGIRDIKLAAVEGAAGHVTFMQQHFRDNDLDPDEHLVLHAVAGTYDGIARFPRLEDPVVEWGGEALYDGATGTAERTEQVTAVYDEVRCISVPTLLAELPPVDVVHMDIQGSEGDVVRHAIVSLNERVRRLVIGTHGRDIEAQLFPFLAASGWTLEVETQCLLAQRGSRFDLFRDGVQVWRNPRR